MGTRGPSRLAGVTLALALAFSPAARAQDDLEDVLGGFEESDPDFQVDPPPPETEEGAFDLSGSVEVTGSVNYLSHRSDTGTDYTGLQRLRNRLNLGLDVDLGELGALAEDWQLRLEGSAFYDAAYPIHGRSDYTRQVRHAYERDADVGEAWLAGKLAPALDVKIGRQVVGWGRSETLRVLDVLNPLDSREPGRVDIEDLRLPVSMLRLDAYFGDWSLTGVAIPEIRFDDRPVVGSDFFPGVFEPTEREPSHFEDVELAAALTGIFSRWDVSLHAAWIWDDQPRLDAPRGAPFPTRLVHDRLWLVGAGGNYTWGGWLLKGEVAWLDGLGFFGTGDEKSRLDALLGLEYYGFSDTTFVVEVAHRHLFDHTSALRGAPNLTREDSPEIALRATRNFWNDTLHVTAVAVLLGWEARDGAIVRADVDYDVLDALSVGVGILLYQQGDLPPLDAWGDNDRLLFKVKWSF